MRGWGLHNDNMCPAAPKPEADPKDFPDSRTEQPKLETPNQSPAHKPATKPDPGAPGTKYQPNQNSNAKTTDAKSIAAASASATARTSALPEGWEKRWDEKSKRYFYLNHNDNTTQWEAPGESVSRPAAAEAKSASSSASSSSKTTGEESLTSLVDYKAINA